jgi:hypothetical protein
LPHAAHGPLHGQLDFFVLLERQRLGRLEDAVFVNGFGGDGHDGGASLREIGPEGILPAAANAAQRDGVGPRKGIS